MRQTEGGVHKTESVWCGLKSGMMQCDAAESLEVLSAPPQHGYLMT